MSEQHEKNQFRPAPFFMKDMGPPNYTAGGHEAAHASQFRPMKLPQAPAPGSGSNTSNPLPESWGNHFVPAVEECSTLSLGALNSQRSQVPSIASSPSPAMFQVTTTPPRAMRRSLLSNRKNTRVLAVAALCVVVLPGLIGFSLWHFVGKTVPSVTLYQVSMKNVDFQIGGGGTTYPIQRLDISFPFSAHILSVFVQPGDEVRPNQSLVQIDLSQVNAQNLEQLNVQVEQAYQDVLTAQAYLNTVSAVGNPVVIAQARQQYNFALSKYHALQAEASAPALHQGKLTSSMTGIVTAVNVYPGQQLSANKVMLTIFDESSIIVHAQLPLSNYGQVSIKQAVQVTPSALPDHIYNGTVVSIIPNANSQSGTFEVWIQVANTAGTLLPGMSTFVSIHNTLKALVVPRLAVLNPDLDSIVFVVRQQHAYIQHVQVTGYTGDSAIIGAGLSANESIVLVGLDSLQDGQLVHVSGTQS